MNGERKEIEFALACDDVNLATSILIEKLASCEATNNDVEPLHKMLMDKRSVIETADVVVRIHELEMKLKDA